LVASPLIDPPTLIITAAALGWPFAIAKAISAVALGAFGDGVIKLVQDRGYLSYILRPKQVGGCGSGPAFFEGVLILAFWMASELWG